MGKQHSYEHHRNQDRTLDASVGQHREHSWAPDIRVELEEMRDDDFHVLPDVGVVELGEGIPDGLLELGQELRVKVLQVSEETLHGAHALPEVQS